ncbi:MAG: YebC/PmpR family DNA-binding transcriptional regulator [Bacteroidota bacterium]|nr:YebC/PmpR family DNA-binding transcriptional regulator [Bacteroidota bacterium]
MGRAFEFRKARKFKRWSAMSKTFTKLGKEISLAVKAGGPDPTTNGRLRAVIQNAKAVNMPKDNVESAIKKASNKDEKAMDEIVYEGIGPGGVAMMVETATDNPNRTVANLRVIFSRNGGALGNSGSVSFQFERKGVFEFPADGINIEELELELIDFGAQEISVDEGVVYVETDFVDFAGMQKALEERKIPITTAELQRIATSYKEGLTDEVREELEILLEKLEEDDDVQNVFHNMA